MVRTAAAKSRQEERTERRKAQILKAARACVRLDGFHAASMSRIAAEAAMSSGHIYQYFDSKEAIMIALCDSDFEEFMQHITEIDRSYAGKETDFTETLLAEIPWLLDHDRAALALEVMAEAGRNPKVADMVSRVDRRFHDTIRKIITPMLEGLSEKEIEARVQMMLILMRALVLHAAAHPVSDPQVIAAGYEPALRGVLSPACYSES